MFILQVYAIGRTNSFEIEEASVSSSPEMLPKLLSDCTNDVLLKLCVKQPKSFRETHKKSAVSFFFFF